MNTKDTPLSGLRSCKISGRFSTRQPLHQGGFENPVAPTRPEDTLGTAAGREESYNLVFSRGYGERLNWIKDYFSGLERVYSRRDSAGSSPLVRPHALRYQVTGGVQPRLQWIFPSLESVLDLALAQSLCAEEPVLRVCKNCGKIYYNPHVRSEFCSVRCRNQYNVRAWRSRRRENG